MFSKGIRNAFYWALGIIVTGAMIYIFYSKEMEIRKENEQIASNCSDFHQGTFVYYYNGLKPDKRIFINKDIHLEYKSDSNWIKSRIKRFDDCYYSLEIIEKNTPDTTKKIGYIIEIKIDKTEQDTMTYRVNKSGIIKRGRLVKTSDQTNSPLM